MSNLSANGLSLIQKLDAIAVELRRQEGRRVHAQRQKETEQQNTAPPPPVVIEESVSLEASAVSSSKIELLTKENKDLKSRNDKLATQLRARDSQLAGLTEKHRQLSSTMETLQLEKDSVSHTRLKWSDAYHIESLLSTLKAERAALTTMVVKNQNQFAELTEHANQLMQDLNAAREEGDALRVDTETLREENDRQEAQMLAERQENSDMRVENVLMRAELSKLQSQLRDAGEELDAAVKRCQEMESSLHLETAAKESVASQWTSLERESQSHAAQMAKAHQEKSELIERYDAMVKGLHEVIAAQKGGTGGGGSVVSARPTPTSRALEDLTGDSASVMDLETAGAPMVAPREPVRFTNHAKMVRTTDALSTLSHSRRQEALANQALSPAPAAQVPLYRKASHHTVEAPRRDLSEAAPQPSHPPTVSSDVAEVCSFCKEEALGMMNKCSECRRGFHTTCRREFLKARQSAGEGGSKDADSGAPSSFVCNDCFKASPDCLTK